VDSFRKNILGQYLTEFPDCTAATISKFSIMIMWLNRSAILFQLAYKDKTNFDLLKVSRKHKFSLIFIQKQLVGLYANMPKQIKGSNEICY
jgi:3-methyladenine DNA glycosylase AlkD